MSGISSKAANFGDPDNKRGFNGGNELQNEEFSDGSGLELYDAVHRMYDPQIARFGQLDPMMEAHTDLSTYSFVNNNPLLYSDPAGLDTIRVNGPGAHKIQIRQGDVLAMTIDGTTGYYIYDPSNKDAQGGFVSAGMTDNNTLSDVKVTSHPKNESSTISGLGLAGLGLGLSYGETKMFNKANWFDLAKGRSYSQRYYGNQYRGAEDIKAAKGLSQTASRGLKFFGWGIGLWSQFNIFNDNKMSTSQKRIETGSNAISTFGGLYGAGWGVGWETGRVLTQQDWYRQNVRPHLQDLLGVERDEVPKLDPKMEALLNYLEKENNKH